LYAKLIAEKGSIIGLHLVAAADPRADLGMSGVEQFRNAEELLRLPIDAILIASPPDSHYEIARLVLQSGKHALIEKPPAASAAEAAELIALARDRGVTAFFAYHARYNRSVQSAKKALAAAVVESFEITYRENVLRYHDSQSWVFQEGVLKDSGVNALSVLAYVVPAERCLDVTQAEFVRSRRWGAITKARLALRYGARANGSMTLDWTHQGAESRDIAIRIADTEFVIDLVSDRLMRNAEVVCSGDCDGDRLACEYREMLDDFADHISAAEPSNDTSELRLLDTAARIAVVVEGP
jgi:D-galactose 1-dehydrogenase